MIAGGARRELKCSPMAKSNDAIGERYKVMRMQKNEARKQAVVEFVKANCETSGWSQEQNADAICRRVLALAKQSGVQGDVLKKFAMELIADLTISGLGLYGNTSQFRQVLLGKDAAKAEQSSDVSSLLAGYEIE